MSHPSLAKLRETMPPRLGVYWCDRCGRAINANEESDHFHFEQCGGCHKFRRLDADWGYCSSHEGVYGGRFMFEHDTCSKWVEGQ